MLTFVESQSCHIVGILNLNRHMDPGHSFMWLNLEMGGKLLSWIVSISLQVCGSARVNGVIGKRLDGPGIWGGMENGFFFSFLLLHSRHRKSYLF